MSHLYVGKAKAVADKIRGGSPVERIEKLTPKLTILHLENGRKVHIRWCKPDLTWVELFKSHSEWWQDTSSETLDTVKITNFKIEELECHE